MDNLEGGTLHSEGVDWDLTDILRGRQDIQEEQSTEGYYRHRNVTFFLSTLAPHNPIPGDTLRMDDDGITYAVLSVLEPSHNIGWALTCREMSIDEHGDDNDHVTLYPAVHELTGYGSQVTTHPDPAAWFTSVDAKIMLRESVAEDDAGQRDFVKVYDIVVDEDLGDIHDGDLLQDNDGNWYTIVSWRNRGQIDDLSTIVCEDRTKA